jgi:GNAT superfamily N-acetyltransferase
MSSFTLRAMKADEWDEVAGLVRDSTNHWYESHARPPIFTGDPEATRLFCEVYEALDPGRCLVAVNDSGRIAGSCFYRQRETHVALGIMNVHQDFFGQGIARQLLVHITDFADSLGLPTRLVSSAINLDSFSLYTRAGFVPGTAFQDMYVADISRVPGADELAGSDLLRPATIEDAPAMADLEKELVGIRREEDHRFFIDNAQGIWHVLVSTDETGAINGFLSSVHHPGSHMLGPGVMRDESVAAALIAAQLRQYESSTPVFLVPCDAGNLVATLYSWGARNCELHFAQVRGDSQRPTGIVMPSFMPETG